MGSVVTLGDLKKIRGALREQKKTVVFTNGVFDILHGGHVEYLNKSKALGDILIVGMNSDSSVRRIKGEKRPIVGEGDRSFVLSNLNAVDYICLFDEDTPLNLISAIVPDILVKGADWNVDAIVGKDVVERAGGKVMTIEFVPDRSTTSIIDRILERFQPQ
jgi:rfaE bifunctional protein nucleotidyltransferase chain/domain